jgi:enoyl-CoA hydratase
MSETNDVVTWAAAAPGVVTVTLSSPRANALGLPIIDGLNRALDAIDSDASVKVIVVSSGIPGFFAAGADIKHMSSIDAASFAGYGDLLRAVLNRLAAARQLTIAAVDGLALGGGLELAMACALRVAGDESKLGLPEVKLGLIPGAGGTQRLPRLVGRGRALDIMLSGRQVAAAEAGAIGLVDRVVQTGTATAAAVAWAQELCTMSLPAQRAVLRTVGAAFDLPLAEGLGYEDEQVYELFDAGEAKEGLTAFLEKRAPKFA